MPKTKLWLSMKLLKATKLTKRHTNRIKPALNRKYGAVTGLTKGANQTGKETNTWVDTKVNDLKSQYADADVTVKEQVVSSGNRTSVLDYTNYGKAVETIQTTNEQAVADYLTKENTRQMNCCKNQAIQKENEAGLAKAKADNEAIEGVIRLVKQLLMLKTVQVKPQ